MPILSAAVSPAYPKLARFYTGTIHDIPTNLTTTITFTDIQQQQGEICGYFGGMPTNAVFSGIPANGLFKGTITASRQIQFKITSDTGLAAFSFNGLLSPDGSIAGTYCSPGT